MAWTNSKVFARFVFDKLSSSAAVADFDTDAIKVALYGTSITPDNTVATDALSSYNGAASQWVTGNEITSGTGGWPAGGIAATSLTVTQTTNVVKLDAADTPSSTSGATITAAYGCLVYDSTTSAPTNIGVSYNYFGGSQSVTAGLFTIVWNANGIATFTT